MGHDITSTDQMITVKKQAWHKLGTVIPEHVTPKQALQMAGLEWDVVEGSVSATFEEQGQTFRVVDENHKMLLRSDTKEPLGIVGKDYKVMQNSELADFISDVTAGELAAVETAGSLKGGKRVWFLLGGEQYDVAGVDPVSEYGLFCNGHDGGLATRVLPTTIRVVCNNTFTAAGAENLMKGISIRHTKNAQERVDEARTALTKNVEQIQKFREAAETLAKVEVDTKWLTEFFMSVYIDSGATPPTPIRSQMTDKERKRAERAQQRAEDTLKQWFANFEDADDGNAHKKIRTTAWAAFNSVTRWADHGRTVKNEKKDPTARVYANLLGTTASLKSMTLNKALTAIS